RRNRRGASLGESRRGRCVRALVRPLVRALILSLIWGLTRTLLRRLLWLRFGTRCRCTLCVVRMDAHVWPPARAEPGAHFVQPQRVRQRLAVSPGFGGVVGVEYLVKNPACDQDPEYAPDVCRAHQGREDHHMHQSLDELTVVHGAYARDQPQYSRHGRAGRAGGRRHEWLLKALPRLEARLAKNLSTGRVAQAI